LTLTGGYFGHGDDTQNTVFCLFEPRAPGLAADSFPNEDSVYFGTRPGKRNCFMFPTVAEFRRMALTEAQILREVKELRRIHTRGEDMDPEKIKRIAWEYKNVYDGPTLANLMTELAAKHPRVQGSEAGTPTLPVMANLTQALNVAASDPCAVLAVVHPAERDLALEQKLARLVFEQGIAGRAYVARLTEPEWAQAREIGQIRGGSPAPGVYFVAPSPYGLDGEVWTEIAPDATEQALRTELVASLDRFLHTYKKLDRASHLEAGVAKDISWSEYDPDFGGIVRIGPGSKKLGKHYDPKERGTCEPSDVKN
jgi:hypothetical protein